MTHQREAYDGVTALWWNVADSLSEAGKAGRIFNRIARFNPTVAVFTEACPSDAEDMSVMERAERGFQKLGYQTLRTSNADRDDELYGINRTDTHDILAITKRGDLEVVGLGPRNGIFMTTEDPVTKRVLSGVVYHGDDRTIVTRRASAETAVSMLTDSARVSDPWLTFVMGGINSDYAQAAQVRTMSRVLDPIAKRLPYEEPKRHANPFSPARWGNITRRIRDMTSDDVLSVFTDAGFEVPDRRRATFPSRLPVLALEHVVTGPGLSIEDHKVHRSLLTDHRPSTARLVVRATGQNVA